MPEIRAYVTHNNTDYMLCKTTTSRRQQHVGIVNSQSVTEPAIVFPALAKYRVGVTIAILTTDTSTSTSTKYLFFNIRPTGSFNVRITWNEEDGMDMSRALEHIKSATTPVIDLINTFGHYVFMSGRILPHIDQSNIIYQGMNINVDWKRVFVDQTYKLVRGRLAEYSKTGILSSRLGTVEKYEFMFHKGMHSFDRGLVEKIVLATGNVLLNHYTRFTDSLIKQKWDQHYSGRIIKIEHRSTGVKFEIYDVKEKEFAVFHSYITAFLYQLHNDSEFKNPVVALNKDVRRLKKLQESDPELYRLKKHGLNKVYSRVCMKSHQPNIFTQDEVANMSARQVKQLHKYWNFTLGKPAYYACTSDKYPQLSFLINIHPKGYCLPCCGKRTHSDDGGWKKRMYDTCVRDHKFDPQSRDRAQAKHIIDYGKRIDPGRLAKLPALIGKDLLVDTMPDASYVYCLFGVEQNTSRVNDVGALFSIVACLSTGVDKFIRALTPLITDRMFGSLLGGVLAGQFKSRNAFVDTMTRLFISEDITVDTTLTQSHTGADTIVSQSRIGADVVVDWNRLFIELSYRCGVCGVFAFADNSRDGSNIELDIDVGLHDELSKDARAQNSVNIMVCVVRGSYYPIFLVNADEYFKRGTIFARNFVHGDTLSHAVTKLALYKSATATAIYNLSMLQDFVNVNTSYKIITRYINKNNRCYAALITCGSDSAKVYVPVDYSIYATSGSPISFDAFSRSDHDLSPEELAKFIEQFNSYLGTSRVTQIIRHATIVLGAVTIGFTSTVHLRYYHNDQPLTNDKEVTQMERYDYSDVNKHILAQTPPTIDNRNTMLGRALYDNFIYQLFVVEFANHVERERNTEMRERIKKILSAQTDVATTKRSIKQLVHPADYDAISKVIHQTRSRTVAVTVDEVMKHRYQFDQTTLASLRGLKSSDVVAILVKTAEHFAVERELPTNEFEFPNMFVSCQEMINAPTYCTTTKQQLIVPNLRELCELLAYDLSNELKSKFFFNNIWAELLVDYFKFINHANENITVTPIRGDKI